MIGLFGLIAIALVLGPIAMSVLAFRRSGQTANRVATLERAIDDLTAAMRQRTQPLSPKADPDPAFEPNLTPTDDTTSDRAPITPEPPVSDDTRSGAKPASAVSADQPPPAGSPPRDDVAAPASQPSFEERLGTRWAVWAGGAALALGGVFLVRFSIEAGLLGPGVRVLLGAMLAAALLASGEWLRRNDTTFAIEVIPQAHIPSVLTAAGTSVAFATIYAAHALYGFIGPALAFILLGSTALLAMLGAALHGPWLAGLGVAGAYVTPLLISSDSNNPWPVVIFFTVVAAAAYGLARLRHWLWLAWTAVAGAAVWGLLLTPGGAYDSDALGLAAQVFAFIQLALAAGFLAIEPHAGARDADSQPDRVATIALGVLTAVASFVIAAPSTAIANTPLFAIIVVMLLTATAWRSAAAASAAVLAAAIAVVALTAWPDLALPPDRTLTAPDALGVLRLPDNISQFLAFGFAAALIPSVVSGYRLWRGPLLPTPTAALYAAAIVLPPLLALTLTYLRITQFDISIPFALGAAVLAIAFAIGAETFHRADTAYSVPAYNIGAGIVATGAIAALSLAFVMCMSRGYLTVALALTAAGAAYIASQRDIIALRATVAGLGLIVLGRLIYDPRIMGGDVGSTPIFNWLLIGYGVPAAAFAFAARQLEIRTDDLAVRVADSLSIIFVGLLAFFQIRHLTNGGDVLTASTGHVEVGLQAVVSLGMSYALARANALRTNRVFDTASLVLAVIALVSAIIGLMIVANPLITGDAVSGAPLFGSLLLAYGLPGLAALFVARHARDVRPQWYVRAAGIAGVVLITMFVTLAVRQSFQGTSIGFWRPTGDAEHWAYSAAWLVLGIALLAYGLWRESLEARAASAALVILAAVKITLFDLAGIGGIWRALSFLCLGAVLIGIGLVYQRLIFKDPSAASPR